MLKSKIQNPNFKTLVLSFVICALLSVISDNAYALDLKKVKIYFLSGDYASCINEGEKILAGEGYSKGIDELYYLLGLSYLREGNYLRASDIFEIILKEFKDSKFQEDALLGLGDAYFLKGDYAKARGYYKDLINRNPRTKLLAQAYYRISQCAFKAGNTREGEEYLGKIKASFPLNPETKLSPDLTYPLTYYTVQVGSFSSVQNARNLVQKLTQESYSAYIEELNSEGKLTYRVRVGRFKLRQEAENLSDKLSREGYPTKIYP